MKLNNFLCILGIVLSYFAIELILGSLVVMLWRINKVMNQGLKKVIITSNEALRIVAIMTVIISCLLILLILIGEPYVGTIEISSTYDPNNCITSVTNFKICKYQNPVVYTIFGVVVGAIALYGLYLAYKTRNVADKFNNSGIVALGKIWTKHFVIYT